MGGATDRAGDPEARDGAGGAGAGVDGLARLVVRMFAEIDAPDPFQLIPDLIQVPLSIAAQRTDAAGLAIFAFDCGSDHRGGHDPAVFQCE